MSARNQIIETTVWTTPDCEEFGNEADAWEHANHLDLRAVCEKLDRGHADDLAAALKRSEPELLRRLINALEPLA